MRELPGTLIGPYKLLEQIGEGSVAVVFAAEQLEPVRRKVAIKIPKPESCTPQLIARFEAERQALALMDHPNIARIFDAGAAQSGLPYFVMELIHGLPITEYSDQYRLTLEQRLELIVQLCRAMEHFHDVRRIILNEQPPKPSTRLARAQDPAGLAGKRRVSPSALVALVQGELDGIVMKCLEKDRDRRYQTATELADAIEQFLHRQRSLSNRLGQFVRSWIG